MVSYYNLHDTPNNRSSHEIPVPTLGGMSFFVALIFSLFSINFFDSDGISFYLIISLIMIFLIGLKDDLSIASPKSRLIVELIAIGIILFHKDFTTINVAGFLGLYELSVFYTNILSVLVFITIINAINLIDGVNGLAATIGIISFSVFAHIFLRVELYFYFYLCITLIASLLAFLRYNFSPTKNIFMGDTGSLIIGFMISFFSLKFLSIDTVSFSSFKFIPENKMIIIGAIVSIPLFDLFRVFIVRLLNGKSPFVADRNHVHHILLDSGLPHYKVTLMLGFVNYAVIVIMMYLSSYFGSALMLLLLAIMFISYTIGLHYLKKSIS